MRRTQLLLAIFIATACTATARTASAASECTLGRLPDVPVTTSDLRPLVPAKIDGRDVLMMVDSGAFFSAVTEEFANSMGARIISMPNLRVVGIGGTVDGKRTEIREFELAGAKFRNADFLVLPRAGPPNAAGLIGQNLLAAIDIEYDLANGAIRFFQPKGACARVSRIYWAPKQGSFVTYAPTTPAAPHMLADVTINGVRLRAMFDTGASRSMLSRRAAVRAGVALDADEVEAGGSVGGIGRRATASWEAPIASFTIGDETIQNTRMMVGNTNLSEADLLLGADFFLSHRVYVAKADRRIYFTYNGGAVFRLDGTNAAGGAVARSDDPTDAEGFARRAVASASRRDFAASIADYSRAVELAPDDPDHLVGRARTRLMNRDPILAMADLAEALRLEPAHGEALTLRGRLYLSQKDEPRARADFEAAAKASSVPMFELIVASSYENAEHYETSVEYLDRWIAANPKHAQLALALNQRCWTRALWNRQLDQALADCDSSLRLRPNAAEVFDSRGLVKLRQGRFEAAIADYTAALKIQPKLASSLHYRGVAKIRQGMKDEGEADIKAAAALDPQVAEAAKRLKLDS